MEVQNKKESPFTDCQVAGCQQNLVGLVIKVAFGTRIFSFSDLIENTEQREVVSVMYRFADGRLIYQLSPLEMPVAILSHHGRSVTATRLMLISPSQTQEGSS